MNFFLHSKKLLTTLVGWIFPVHSNLDALLHMSPEALLTYARLSRLTLPDAIAVFSYKDKGIRKLIWSLKYYHNKPVAKLLGEALAHAVIEDLAEKQEFGTFLSPLIIPIPLHPKREAERGYNQSLLIAQAFARQSGFATDTVRSDILFRTKYTEPLAHSASRSERYQSMKDVFTVLKDEQKQRELKNRDVILIDDVITSGATMTEAKRILIEAGAREVLILTIAH